MSHARCLALGLLLVAAGAIAHPARDEQESALARQLRLQPGNAALLLARAQVRFDDGDLEGARSDLETARARGPAPPAIDFVLARVEMEAGRDEAALAAIDRFLASQPAHAAGLALRARALDRRGDAAAARGAWRAAAAATEASGRMATALYLEAAEGQAPAEALALLELGIDRCGPQPLLVKRAAARLLDGGNASRALEHVDRWLATTSGARQPDALALRARCLAELDRRGEACAALHEARAALDADHRRVGTAIRAAAEADVTAARIRLGDCVP